jgi:hypothetical protein
MTIERSNGFVVVERGAAMQNMNVDQGRASAPVARWVCRADRRRRRRRTD